MRTSQICTKVQVEIYAYISIVGLEVRPMKRKKKGSAKDTLREKYKLDNVMILRNSSS